MFLPLRFRLSSAPEKACCISGRHLEELLRIMDRHLNAQPHSQPRYHRVHAVFGDHEQSFDFAVGTTLAQLSERVADLARENANWPVGVSVVFDSQANDRITGRSIVRDSMKTTAETPLSGSASYSRHDARDGIRR